MFKRLTQAAVATSFIPALALAQTKAEPGTYQVDPMHSKVGFEIPHLVISTVEGSFRDFGGEIKIAEKFNESQVNASIDVQSIDTGVGKRDEHLRSADFFDVAKHPKMTFQSSKVIGTPQDFQVKGDLSIRGVKKIVTFKGKYLGAVTDGYGNRKAAFSLKTQIDRKEFGLTWNSMVEAGPVVGDEVTIELRVQAARVDKSKQAAR